MKISRINRKVETNRKIIRHKRIKMMMRSRKWECIRESSSVSGVCGMISPRTEQCSIRIGDPLVWRVNPHREHGVALNPINPGNDGRHASESRPLKGCRIRNQKLSWILKITTIVVRSIFSFVAFVRLRNDCHVTKWFRYIFTIHIWRMRKASLKVVWKKNEQKGRTGKTSRH